MPPQPIRSPRSSSTSSARWATPRGSGDSYGTAVAGIAAHLGFNLLPWQREVAEVAGEITAAGEFRYPTVVVIVPRRAGKTVLMLATVIQRMLQFNDYRAVYLAQSRIDGATLWRDEWWPALDASRLASRFVIRESNGDETISTARGVHPRPSRTRLLAPVEKTGHGRALDLAIIDEAWAHTADRGRMLEAAILPTQSTRPHRQTWIVSAAGTPEWDYIHTYRDRGRAGMPGWAYFEWSAPPEADREDPAVWHAAHPALGHTIDVDYLRGQRTSMDPEAFDRAYLGIWPERHRLHAIPPEAWAAARDPGSKVTNDLVLSFDVTPDRSAGTIAAASMRRDGKIHVEIIEHRPGTGWLLPRLLELYRRHGRPQLVADVSGPAGSIALEAQIHRVRLELLNTAGYSDACEVFIDLLNAGRLAHIGQPPLDAAVEVAIRSPVSDSFRWSRRVLTADISPLVAVTVAAGWAVRPRPRGNVAYLPAGA